MLFPDFRLKALPLVTERETRYMCIMNEVMIEPDWWIKSSNPEEVKRWKMEIKVALLALDSDPPEWYNESAHAAAERLDGSGLNDADRDLDRGDDQLIPHVPYSQFVKQSIKFMFEELEFIAANCIRETPSGAVISPTSIHGVFISDSIIPQKLLSKFNAQAASVETDSLAKEKWNKNSNNTVLDLVHPSDYCAVYGVSKLRKNAAQICGIEPVIYSGPTAKDASARFQWLPSEFRIDGAGKVHIQSYINNLNRRVHNELYDTIAAVFEAMVPMFEMTVGSFTTEPTPRIHAPPNISRYQQDFCEWCKERTPKMGIFDTNSAEFLNFMNALWGQPQPINIPGLPESFDSSSAANLASHMSKLETERTYQVYVQMATIHLTPENPVYNGGNWHLEGKVNEAIGATGIVYYDMSNFQSFYDDGCLFDFEQRDFSGLERVFGVSPETLVHTQIRGQIDARNHRAVVFPDFLHHKVKDFELDDKKKPGFCRILVFFLVHPLFCTYSTRTVAMQQRDWVAQDLFDLVFKGILPYEIVESVVGYLGSTFSAVEAAVYAHELSEERSNPSPTDLEDELLSVSTHSRA
ncbi:hypothetical protein CcCBS67573_g09712 [Chytriomyces confervae]|uniref:DUF4246 domain-containing protein n=1 Tax=Chytriomyces confervae TaxID=246404 RepID=A0A507DR34_9FUNG|nr:hypothetical protein CcCBS67573_g09712 [Chytriomyces confervae]